MENKKKSIFLIFAPKMRLTKNFRDPVSQNFTKQISKMALPRAGRGFNLKTHQRRTLYLYPFQNGGRSPEPLVVVAPPPTGIGLKEIEISLILMDISLYLVQVLTCIVTSSLLFRYSV